jgi:2'-5' RNA ligase
MLRAFLAIDLPASLRPPLARVQEELRKSSADVRWVPVGNIHLTLKFFGQIPDTEVELITQAAGKIAGGQAPFTLEITQAGAFPSVKSPRVVWLGIGGDLPVMEQFQRKLEGAFAELEHLPEDRAFAPHLTLGRVRSSKGRQELSRRLTELPPLAGDPFQVSEIILFRSTLSPQGATYLPLKVIPLGA